MDMHFLADDYHEEDIKTAQRQIHHWSDIKRLELIGDEYIPTNTHARSPISNHASATKHSERQKT